MSSAHSEENESRITTDRETIEGWVGEHDAVPVRYTGVEGESNELRIVPETEREESHEELRWEDFHDEIDRNDQVVVYHGADHPEPFEVTSREQAIGRTTVANEEVEEALIEGETVTGEVMETTVVERTIVEEATVESEVVDREAVSEEIVDAELLTRDVVDCGLVGGETDFDVGRDAGVFEPEHRETFDEGLGVEMTVDEGWTVTKEVVEQLTIESRVVDAEATETDTVEADSIESSVDIEGVQQTIVDSDLVDTEAGVDVIESGNVESEFREGETVQTRLLERKTVDEEISLRRQFTGEITEGETIAADRIHREAIESEIVGEEDVDAEAAAGGTVTVGEVGDEAVMPSEDDEGKTVVDASGDEVGMVVDVEGDTLYVDPHPSITDKIMTALGWGDTDEEDYPIGPERVARVTDDEVELVSVEPEMEAKDEATEDDEYGAR